MVTRRPRLWLLCATEIVDGEDWRGELFRLWNEPDACLYESDWECGGARIAGYARCLWARDQAGVGYGYVYERDGCDCAEHDRLDGGHAVCALRLLAAGEIEPDVATYAPGGSVYGRFTRMTGLGGRRRVGAPDGASTTSYLYTGADVKVTGAAGKWKKFTTDAAGAVDAGGGAEFQSKPIPIAHKAV